MSEVIIKENNLDRFQREVIVPIYQEWIQQAINSGELKLPDGVTLEEVKNPVWHKLAIGPDRRKKEGA